MNMFGHFSIVTMRFCAKPTWLLLLLCLGGAERCVRATDLTDLFTNRQTVTNDSGAITGSNTLATLETDEPKHGGKVGGHSVWVTWRAPADGIVTIDTAGSSFDTLLGVYTLDNNTNNPPLKRLHEVVENDDNGTLKTSLVQFGAQAGTNYEIAVDGYNGAVGAIQLNWSLLRASKPPPIIVSLPADRALQAGDTLTLTVDYIAKNSTKLLWFFNDTELTNEESATLVIPNFQETNVGQYKLRLTASGLRFFTQPVEIQINTEGLTNTLARDKIFDAPASALHGNDGSGSSSLSPKIQQRPAGNTSSATGVLRGYSGTQIFNTTFATTDPTEPAHCGVTGGTSYWLAYLPPTNGTAHLDTAGSTYSNILAVYTYLPPLISYTNLIPVNCATGGTNGLVSELQFTAAATNTYLVVVDGLNGVRGIGHLNYSFTTAPPTNATPPAILQNPVARTVAVGSTVNFDALVSGAAPLSYEWRKNNLPISGQTNTTLTLGNVQTNDAGDFTLKLTNPYGSVTSAVAALTIIVPPAVTQHPVSTNLLAGTATALAVAASGTAPLHYFWNKDGAPITNDAPVLTLSPAQVADAGTYSVQIINAAGQAVSSNAAVAVLGRATGNMNSTNGGFNFSFAVGGGAGFVVEFTDSLNPPLWTNWPGALVTNDTVISLTDNPQANALRLFRVRLSLPK